MIRTADVSEQPWVAPDRCCYMPFYPSPLKDDGYDISRYDDVHPQYGTLDDFREMLAGAHQRGLKVITELVINHTSDQHPWFQAARRAPPGSPERDFYVWSDTDRKYLNTRIIFTDTETSNWTWDPVAKAFFWHRFFNHQPDLNFDNPKVLEAVLDTMRFWLDMHSSTTATWSRRACTTTGATTRSPSSRPRCATARRQR